MSDSATTSVTVSIGELSPVRGRGAARYLTFAELDIAGVTILLQGISIVSDRFGRMHVELPKAKAIGSGAWCDPIILPGDLLRELERAILAAVPGVSTVYVTAAADA